MKKTIHIDQPSKVTGLHGNPTIAPGEDGRWYVVTGTGPDARWFASFATAAAAWSYMMSPPVELADYASWEEFEEATEEKMRRFGGQWSE